MLMSFPPDRSGPCFPNPGNICPSRVPPTNSQYAVGRSGRCGISFVDGPHEVGHSLATYSLSISVTDGLGVRGHLKQMEGRPSVMKLFLWITVAYFSR